MENCILNTNTSISESIIATNSQIISKEHNSEKKKLLLGEGTKIIL